MPLPENGATLKILSVNRRWCPRSLDCARVRSGPRSASAVQGTWLTITTSRSEPSATQAFDALHRQIQVFGIEAPKTFVEEERIKTPAATSDHLRQSQRQSERRKERLPAREAIGAADHVGCREVNNGEPIVSKPVSARGQLLEVLAAKLGESGTLLV